MNNKKIYVVTNATYAKNYTPSVFKKESDARDWFYKLSIEDAIDAFSDDMIEYLIESIKENSEDTIEKFKSLLKSYEKYIDTCDEDYEKDMKYVQKANKLIEKFNKQMEENEIPFRLLEIDDACEIEDIISDFIEGYDEEYFDLYSLVENKEKEYIEFFGDNISGFEYNTNKILLEYNDDSFNCIEFFEVDVN